MKQIVITGKLLYIVCGDTLMADSRGAHNTHRIVAPELWQTALSGRRNEIDEPRPGAALKGLAFAWIVQAGLRLS